MLESHKIEDLSMKRGDAAAIDRALGFQTEGRMARAYARPPRSHSKRSDSRGTGAQSPFARCIEYLCCRAEVRPEGASILIAALRMQARLVTAFRRGRSRVELALALLKQATKTAEVIASNAPPEEVQKELLKLEGIVVEVDYEVTPQDGVLLKLAQVERHGAKGALTRTLKQARQLQRELKRSL